MEIELVEGNENVSGQAFWAGLGIGLARVLVAPRQQQRQPLPVIPIAVARRRRCQAVERAPEIAARESKDAGIALCVDPSGIDHPEPIAILCGLVKIAEA